MPRVTVRETPKAGPDFADRIAFFCFFLSGVLGLVYEVAWIKKASLVFGSATYALSTVVAVFFGGLALGSWFFAREAGRQQQPLLLYARLEIGLGVLAIASPILFRLCDWVYGALYPGAYESFLFLTVLRALLTALAILPATFLMGATLPLFCRQYVSDAGTISGSVGFLYGLNTLGAALGAFLTGFVLLPAIGVDTSIYAAGAASIAIGLVVRTVAGGKRVQPDTAPVAKRAPAPEASSVPTPEAVSPRTWAIVSTLFFLSGSVILANEILWARYLTLLTRNTVHTYSLTLGVILLGIVAGAWMTRKVFDQSQRLSFQFGAVQVLAGIVVLFVLLLPADWWRTNFVGSDGEASAFVFALVLFVPALLSGIAFPLAVRMVVDQPRLAAVNVGRLVALNTFGGIVGALEAGFFFLPELGLETSIRLTTGSSLLVGFAAWFLLDPRQERPKKIFLAAASVGAWAILPGFLGTRLPDDFLARPGDEVVAVREGKSANLAVLERRGVRILEIDRLWQGENRKTHQIMAAHIPMLVHPAPKEVAVIGLGTGQTASRFLHYDLERLDCVDIEGELVEVVRDYFEADWMEDPRVNFVTEDGRNYLRHIDREYDIVSVEVGQTFRPGVSAFYTREFYEEAREHLREDGLLCQFVPIMFLNADECAGVIATFLEVFPQASLWYNTGELLLIGAKAPSFQIATERLELTRTNPRVSEDLHWSPWGGKREQLDSPAGVLASFLMGSEGLRELCKGGAIYTDDRPVLDYSVSEPRDPRAEVAIVEALSASASSPAVFLDRPTRIAREDQNRIDQVREGNLKDLQAAPLGRAGYQAYASQNYAEAREILRKALRVQPRNVPLRLYLGRVYEALDQPSDALREYQTALGVDPDRTLTHERLAAAYEVEGNTTFSLRHRRTLHELHPDDFQRALAYGRSLIEAGDPKNALQVLEPHAERADAELHFQLGRAYSARRQDEQTLLAYERCLELDSKRVEARVNLGVLYMRLRKSKEAIAQFEQAVRVKPTLVNAHYNLSIALAREERYDEAIEAGERVLQLKRDFHPAYDHLGTMHYKKGEYREAVQMYEKALEIKPDFSNALGNLERARAKLGG